MEELLDYLSKYMLPCFFKKWYGIDCPGCGLQRSIILLLKGEIIASIKMYPPLIPIILTFAANFINNRWQFIKNKKVFNKAGVILAIIVAVNFFYKIITLALN